MTKPDPETGLVFSFDYLWDSDKQKGWQEGGEHRPCVVAYVTPRDVKIVDRGTPRLSPVSLTRWRGKVEGQGVKFDFHHTKNGFWTSGEMRLAPREEAGHFALTWSSTSGGVGGHVPIGSPEESADCIPEAMASR